MSSFLKNIIFAIVFAGVLWVGYRMFFASDPTSLVSSNVGVATEASRSTQDFLRALQQLRDISLNEKIFDDARFQSLEDHRQIIIEEPVGRKNPFAPIGQ